MPRRVLVVGAGVSGLIAIKECREAGLDVVCLEALPWVGGLWRFTDNESHSSVYRCVHAGRRAGGRAGRGQGGDRAGGRAGGRACARAGDRAGVDRVRGRAPL